MEKIIGNSIVSFKKNRSVNHFGQPKNNAKVPHGLKSKDQIASHADLNVFVKEDQFIRDKEIIRDMQIQGVVRKLSKKDSLKLRRNKFINNQKELNEIGSKNLFFKEQNPYLLFKKATMNNIIVNDQKSNLIGERRISLYSKLQNSLQKYMSNHSKELILQGNKRYQGKSGDYYLQSKKGDMITEIKPNFETIENKLMINKNTIDSPKKVVKNLSVGKIITFTKKNITRNNLTPIPLIQKKKIRNNVEHTECSKAERTAVQIRRIEYSNSMKKKSIMIKSRNYYDQRIIDAVIIIQNWWRIILFRNRRIIQIQSHIRGFLARKGINELITYANILNLRLAQLHKSLSIPFIKPFFEVLYDNFALESHANDFLNIVLYLQIRIRKFLIEKKGKSSNFRKAIKKMQDIKNKRRLITFKLIKISKRGLITRQKQYFKYNKGFEVIHKYSLRKKLNKLSNFCKLKSIIERILRSYKNRKMNYYFNHFNLKRKNIGKMDKAIKLCESAKKFIISNYFKKILPKPEFGMKFNKCSSSLLKSLVNKKSMKQRSSLIKRWSFVAKQLKKRLKFLKKKVCQIHILYLDYLKKLLNKWKANLPNKFLGKLRINTLKSITKGIIKFKNERVQKAFNKWRILKKDDKLDFLKGLGKILNSIKLVEDKKSLLRFLIKNTRINKFKEFLIKSIKKQLIQSKTILKKSFKQLKFVNPTSTSKVEEFASKILVIIKRRLQKIFKLISQKKNFKQLKKIISNKTKFDNILNEKLIVKNFPRFVKSVMKKGNNEILNDFLKKVDKIKEFIRKIENLMKRKLINFPEISKKLICVSFKLLKILNVFREKEIETCKMFFEVLKKNFNWTKDKRNYILKALIKSEGFKLTFNKKLIFYSLWKNIKKPTPIDVLENFETKKEIKIPESIPSQDDVKMDNEIIPNTKNLNRIIKKICNIEQKNRLDSLKAFLIKLKEVSLKSRVEELKAKIIKSLFRIQFKKLYEISFKKYFNIWRQMISYLKKEENEISTNKFKQGLRILQNHLNSILQGHFIQIYKVFKKKTVLKSSRKMVQIKERKDDVEKKKYFYLWKRYVLYWKIIQNSRNYLNVRIKNIVQKMDNKILKSNLRVLYKKANILGIQTREKLNNLCSRISKSFLRSTFYPYVKKILKKANLNYFGEKFRKICSGFSVKTMDNLSYYLRKLQLNSIRISNINILRNLREKFLNILANKVNQKTNIFNLSKIWRNWKILILKKEDLYKINMSQALEKLKNTLLKFSYNLFKNECFKFWPKLKFGVSPQEVSLKGSITLAKVLFLRNIIYLRKYFNQLNENSKKEQRNEFTLRFLNQIIRKTNNKSKQQILREYFLRFFKKIQLLLNKNQTNYMVARLTFNIQKKKTKYFLSRYIRLWLHKIKIIKKFDSAANLLIVTLKKYPQVELIKLLKNINEISNKKEVSTKQILRSSRKLEKKHEKNNKNKYFAHWKKRIFQKQLQGLKQKMLRFLLIRMNNKSKNYNPLAEYYGRFIKLIGNMIKPIKISDLYEIMTKFKRGINKIIFALIKKPFEKLLLNLKKNRKSGIMKMAITLKNNILKKYLLIMKMRKWLLKSKNARNPKTLWKLALRLFRKNKAKLGFRIIFDKAVKTKFYCKLLVLFVKRYFYLANLIRKNNIVKVKKLLKKNLIKKKTIKQKKRHLRIKKILEVFGETSDSLMKRKFIKWSKIAMLLIIKNSANYLIKFSNKILEFRKRKTVKLLKSTEIFFNKMEKKRAYNKLVENSNSLKILQKLKDRITQQFVTMKLSKEKTAIKLWSKIVRNLNEDAENKINLELRSIIVEKKEKEFKIKKNLRQFIRAKYQNTKNLIRKCFQKIKDLKGFDKIIQSATTLQNFFLYISNLRMKQINRIKIKELIMNAYFNKMTENLIIFLKKLSEYYKMIPAFIKIIKSCKKNSFEMIKFYIKILILRKILKKKFMKRTSHSNCINYNFEKWKKLSKIKINYSKSKCDKKFILKSEKKSKFMKKKYYFFNEHFNLKKKQFFDNWKVVIKSEIFNNKAILLQSHIRRNFSSNLLRKLFFSKIFHDLSKKHAINLLKDLVLLKEKIRSVCHNYRGTFCKKIAYDNLIIYKSKLKLKKKLSMIIVNKEKKLNNSKKLHKFKLWKFLLVKYNNFLLKIQNNLRIVLAKKKMLKLQKKLHVLKFNLEKYLIKSQQFLLNFFRKWLKESILLLVIKKSIVIQGFIRSKEAYRMVKNIKAKKKLKQIFKFCLFKVILHNNFKKIKKFDKFKFFLKRALFIPLINRLIKKNLNKKKLSQFVDYYDDKRMNKQFLNLKNKIFSWKKNIELIRDKENMAATKVAGVLRSNRAKGIKEMLKIKQNKTSELIISCYKKQDQKLIIYFNKWKTMSLNQNLNDSAKIIQKFLKKKKIELNLKTGCKFLYLTKRLTRYQILSKLSFSRKLFNIFNKLCPLLAQKSMNNFIENLKNFGDYRQLANNIKKTLFKFVSQIKELFIKRLKVYSIQRLRTQNLIAKSYKEFKNKNKRREKVNRLLINLYHSKANLFNVIFKKWLNFHHNTMLNYNSMMIQKFIKLGLNRRINSKLLQLKQFFIRAVDERNLLKELYEVRYKMSLQGGFNKIEFYVNLVFFNNLLSWDLNSMLRKGFIKLDSLFRDKMDENYKFLINYSIGKAASVIQHFLRDCIEKKNQKNKVAGINKIIIQYFNHSLNLNKFYFNQWLKTSNQMKLDEKSIIISRAMSKHSLKLKSKRRLHEILRKFFEKQFMYFTKSLFITIKQYKDFEFAISLMEKYIKLVEYRKIRRISTLKEKLSMLINNYEYLNERDKLTNFFKKWSRMNDKINFSKKFQNILLNLYFNKFRLSLKDFTKISQLKNNFENSIQSLTKYFYQKFFTNLYDFQKKLNASKRLKKTLDKVDFQIIDSKTVNFLSNLFKIYCFRIFDNLKGLTNLKQYDLAKNCFKLMKHNHKNLIRLNYFYNYSNIHQGSHKIKPTVITFKFNNDEPVIYNNFMLIISRFFSGYIQLKIKEKRIDSFVKIKRSSEKSKALSNFLILDQNQLSKSAKYFLKMFRQDYITVKHKDKLRAIFKRSVFIKQYKISKIINRLSRVVYIVRIAFMHKINAEKKFKKELVRKWLFIAVLSKASRNKLMSLYKNYNQLYLAVSEDIFGNDPDSLKNNYTNLNEQIGVFESLHDFSFMNEIKKSNNIINYQTKYNFSNDYLFNEDFNNKSNISEKKENKPIIGINLSPLHKSHSPYRKYDGTYYDDMKREDSNIIHEEEKSLNTSFNNTVDLNEIITDNFNDVNK